MKSKNQIQEKETSNISLVINSLVKNAKKAEQKLLK